MSPTLARLPYIEGVVDENLTPKEWGELLKLTIDADRYPLSPRVRNLKIHLGEARPGAAAEPYSPPKAWVNSTIRQQRRR